MSFPFGGRSTFRDNRSMDRSGDEIIDDMLKNIKQRKKEFFESPPKWRSMGMFDDEVGSAGGSRLKSHLGDIAARHPELADHLFDLIPDEKKPCTNPRSKTYHKKKDSEDKYMKEANKSPQTATTGTQTGGLESDIKLRSTVPDMQASTGESVTDGDRGQRSQSAPPQTPVPNKQSSSEGIRLIPIRTDPLTSSPFPRPTQQNFQSQTPQSQHFQGPPHPQQQQQHSTDQCRQEESGKTPVVRHIPIFVEGRDEPLLPKDAGPSTGMKRGGCQGKTETAPSNKRGPPSNEKQQQQQQHHTQQNHEPHSQQQQQTPQQNAATPPPPPQKPDPLMLVGEVAKEVEALSNKVNEWKGNSRADKEYIYLDEMLTRNLLKLDNIETEGREDIRTARKETIRRIQALISVLESKSASDNSVQDSQQESDNSMDTEEQKTSTEEPMEVKNQNPVPPENSQNGNTNAS